MLQSPEVGVPSFLATAYDFAVHMSLLVPVTIVGTQEVMPKRRFSIRPGTVTIIFHEPIEPKDFGSRECLMAKVRAAINSGLLAEYRG